MNKKSSYTKKYILFLFLILSNLFICQNGKFKEIDELLEKAEYSHKTYQDLKQLEYGEQANLLAIKINNSERITKSYYYMARALFNLDLQNKSLYYIQKTTEEKFYQKDIKWEALIMEIKAYNYGSLNLISQQRKELYNILKILKNSNDNESIEIKARTYANIGQKEKDSILYFYREQGKLLKALPEKKYFSAMSEHYAFLSYIYLEKKIMDSSFYYIKKSYDIKRKYNDPVLYMQHSALGEYYFQEKQYQKALDYFLKSFENMQNFSSRANEKKYVYERIIKIYSILGDQENQKKYTILNSKIQTEAETEKSKSIDYALNVILKDRDNQYKNSRQKSYYWIFLGISSLIICFFLIYKLLRKNLRHKEVIILEKTNILQQKEDIISQKNTETEELQLKVNDAYNEVIALAKANDPSFYFRFQEVYPEFQKILLNNHPGLRNTELTLCAYTFLGFTIKDIAEYTYKSVNTIRNRKQNLRRKFSIPTEKDMGIWLRELTHPTITI